MPLKNSAHHPLQDELPITVTGKAQKFKMRETMVEEPALGEALEKDLIED